MKKYIYIGLPLCIAVAFILAFRVNTSEVADSETAKPLSIGAKLPLPKHEMTLTDNKKVALNSIATKKGLLIMFSSNTCPFVVAWEDRYNELYAMSQKLGLGFVVVNSNEAHRQRGESLKEMGERAKKLDYKFLYALDKDHVLADALGATRTPEIFLFNDKLELAYRGAIDDNRYDKNKVKYTYAQDAMNNMVNKKAIKNAETRSVGCTIKRTSTKNIRSI